MKAVAASHPPVLPPELGSALEASGVVGVWHTNETALTAVLDAGAAALMAGDVALAGLTIPTMALFATMHPDDGAMVLEKVRTCSETCTSFTVEHRVFGTDGETRWIQGRGRFERVPDGTVRGRGIVIDITESRRTGTVIPLSEHALDRRDPLDVAAAHTIAAREAILRIGSPPLRTAVDALLRALGRAIARVQSR